MEYIPFSEKDFDAYLEHKWQSHVFNRERLEVKEKLQTLGRIICPAFVLHQGAPLEWEVSTEHPALWNQQRVENQHLFFSRDEASRRELDSIITRKRSMADLIGDPSPLKQHILLSLMIDKRQIELALKLHADASVDRENLERKCQEYFHREKLIQLVRELPEWFFIGISKREKFAVCDFNDELLSQLIEMLPGSSSWLEISYVLDRKNPIVMERQFVNVVRDNLSLLLPMMSYIAWSRDNDFISIRDTLKQKKVKTEAKGLSKNDQVRVVQGIFVGKSGEVLSVDSRGRIKVRLGTMVVKLKGDEVVKI